MQAQQRHRPSLCPKSQVPEHELLLARLKLTPGAPGSGHSFILMGLGVGRGQLRGRLTERQEPPHLTPPPPFCRNRQRKLGTKLQ